jgi:hypothetical protein
MPEPIAWKRSARLKIYDTDKRTPRIILFSTERSLGFEAQTVIKQWLSRIARKEVFELVN